MERRKETNTLIYRTESKSPHIHHLVWGRLLFSSADHNNAHSTSTCPPKELPEFLHSQISTQLDSSPHQTPLKHAHIKHTQAARPNSLGSVCVGLHRDSKAITCQTKQEKEPWNWAPPDHGWADRGRNPQCESAPCSGEGRLRCRSLMHLFHLCHRVKQESFETAHWEDKN